MIIRLTRVLIIINLLFSGCSREDEKPLVFKPIDLELFSRNLKGFNLIGKVDAGWSNSGYTEEEFIILEDLGFNFARLPLDFRTYTQPGNWNVFLPGEIDEIDKAVEWGRQYGIHISICLHRAPGYCVNPSSLPAGQDLDLWTHAAAQDAFVNHWAYFAERYKDIPYNELSFNLVNEPGDMDESTYVSVMQKAVAKIQRINPDRVIFVDGLKHGRELILSLKNTKNIIQAIHVYDPFTLTHYKASWVSGSDSWPVPVWPMTDISQYLFGPWQQDFKSPLVLEGAFTKDTEITINVQQVSNRSSLQVMLDNSEVYRKTFICGPDPGEDWTEIINTQWGYQNISGKDYKFILPEDGSRLEFTNTDGDWLTFNRIIINSGGKEIAIIPGNTSWGSKQDTYKITSEGKITDTEGNPAVGLRSLINTFKMAKSENIPVMVQEFGVHNQTPHDVTLAYLSDVVSVFSSNRVGYAMWNLEGSMGMINSGRSDCTYEQYRGELLDRAMTTIVQSTGK